MLKMFIAWGPASQTFKSQAFKFANLIQQNSLTSELQIEDRAFGHQILNLTLSQVTLQEFSSQCLVTMSHNSTVTIVDSKIKTTK